MRGSARSRWGELVSDSWRSLTGGGTWRCQLAVSVGGVSWRTNLADLIGGVACGGMALSPDRSARFDARIGRLPIGGDGHWQLALSDWRRNLAEELGGVSWRTTMADLVGGVGLWRYGCEPRLIGTLRCEDRQAPGGVSWSPAVGALWLALSDWRRNLAVSVGGPVRADLVGGVACGGAGLSRD